MTQISLTTLWLRLNPSDSGRLEPNGEGSKQQQQGLQAKDLLQSFSSSSFVWFSSISFFFKCAKQELKCFIQEALWLEFKEQNQVSYTDVNLLNSLETLLTKEIIWVWCYFPNFLFQTCPKLLWKLCCVLQIHTTPPPHPKKKKKPCFKMYLWHKYPLFHSKFIKTWNFIITQ